MVTITNPVVTKAGSVINEHTALRLVTYGIQEQRSPMLPFPRLYFSAVWVGGQWGRIPWVT